MNSIIEFFKSLRNLIPYLALITVYFLFVNIEASNDRSKTENIDDLSGAYTDELVFGESNKRIIIPVIPYKQ